MSPLYQRQGGGEVQEQPLRMHVVLPNDVAGTKIKEMLEALGVHARHANDIWGEQESIDNNDEVMLSHGGPKVIEIIVEKKDPRACIALLSAIAAKDGGSVETILGSKNGPFTVRPHGAQIAVGCRFPSK
ncbi:hypothetical protein FJY93_05235 [Candidatus Kaiserbacteria bacterium]|nr:hypothetical protein [Candidatus Kaiserbacteria bacterium]